MPASLRWFLCTVLLLGGLAVHDASGQVSADSTSYTVQDGDTLYSIARRFGTSVRALRSWNDLEGTAIEIGQTLRIRPPADPSPPSPDADTTRSAPPPADSSEEPSADAPPRDTLPSPPAERPARPDAAPAQRDPAQRDPAQQADSTAPSPPPYGRVSVSRGATLVGLALRLGTTADTLLALNEDLSSPIEEGRVLRLPRRFGPPTHVARSGETMYSIAGQYGVSVRALRRVNDMDTTAIRPGERLRLPGRSGAELPPPGALASPDTTGPAAVYPSTFAGRLTTSGETYNPDALVASHPSLPYGSLVLLSTPNDDRHTFARIVDRGPVDEDVLIDVSEAVRRQLALDADEPAPIALRVVWVAPPE